VTPESRRNPFVALARTLPVLALDAVLLAVGLGGADRLVRDPRAWALLAFTAASTFALALLRPVRGGAPTTARPDPLPMLVLFVVPLVTPMAGAFGAAHAWAIPRGSNTLSWIGVALVGAGLALRIAAMRVLGARFSPLVALQPEHALETRGPYARVRHPGYLGSLVACLGGALAFGSLAALPLPAIMLAAQLARVRAEERLLAAHFGEAWTAYAAHTGALLPRPGALPPRARPG
jgi:protein-S-isoprenylcysteine O-methyltransferase Ste14